MTNQTFIRQSLLFIVLSVVLWVSYCFAVSYSIVLTREVLHSDNSSDGWIRWIYELYPRLQTEKWRFDELFFQSKARQIILRTSLSMQIIIVLYVFRLFLSKKVTPTYYKLTNLTIKRRFVPYITLLLYTCLLLIIYNAFIEFHDFTFFSPFYQPVGIGKFLLPVFPSPIILWFIYAMLIGSIAAVILLPKKWISAAVAVVAFIYYQLIIFGFGKYDHGFSTLTYALLVYPFFLWDAEQSKSTAVPAWSIVLIQWLICLSYFYCGLEKLVTSGPQWIFSDNLQQHLLIHHTPLGLQLAEYSLLCKGLSFAVLALQLSFILLPFYKKLAYLILPAGFLFHGLAWIMLDAGGLFNPWWGVYLFFLFPLQVQETK